MTKSYRKTHHEVYKQWQGNVTGVCYYCGQRGDAKDHVPPISAAHSLGSGRFKELLLVNSCTECNSELGDKWLYTLYERLEYLFDRYIAKYKKELSTPEWKDYELEELGESLRREVVLGQEKKHIALKRIERLQERIATENELRPD